MVVWSKSVTHLFCLKTLVLAPIGGALVLHSPKGEKEGTLRSAITLQRQTPVMMTKNAPPFRNRESTSRSRPVVAPTSPPKPKLKQRP